MQSSRILLIISCLLSWLVAAGGAGFAAEDTVPHLVILLSHPGTPYEDSLQGFLDALSAKGLRVQHEVIQLNGEQQYATKVLSELDRKSVNLLATFGSLATRVVADHGNGLPVVAGLFLDRHFLKARNNITGVSMEFPLELQLQWISRVLPGCRNVGTIYGAFQAEKIEQAQQAAQQAGMALWAVPVKSPSELPLAMDSLASRAEVLWGLPDEMVFNPHTAKQILLYSFRNRIPVVGISEAWVKAGALFALHWDYQDLGRQCGEMAAQILRGTPPQALPLAHPRKVGMVLNLKTAVQLKISIPEAVLQSAQEVYK